MKKILILTQRTLHKAPRVIREIDALCNHYEIHTVGTTAPLQSVASHTDLSIVMEPFIGRLWRKIKRLAFNQYVLKSNIFKEKLNKLDTLIGKIKPDIVICHEVIDLAYVSELKKKYNYKFIYNAHEYHPLEYEEKKDWANTWQLYYEDLYRRYFPSIDILINVCDSFRLKCLEVFKKDSLVIPNACAFYSLEANPVQTPIKLIHHGGAMRGRQLELMIEVAAKLGTNYELTLMLLPSEKGYLEELQEIAKPYKNIQFITPVSYNEIVATINHYDIGIYILAPTNFNNKYALPNKFFEFIQARLCLALGPSPEMKLLTEKYNLGVIAEEFTAHSLYQKIKSLTPEQILFYKQQSALTAPQVSSEHYNQLYLQAVQNLF